MTNREVKVSFCTGWYIGCGPVVQILILKADVGRTSLHTFHHMCIESDYKVALRGKTYSFAPLNTASWKLRKPSCASETESKIAQLKDTFVIIGY